MADVSTKPHRFAWIILVCGLILFAASAFHAVKAFLDGWTLTASVHVLWTFLFGFFWVLLYRRGTKSPSQSEEAREG